MVSLFLFITIAFIVGATVLFLSFRRNKLRSRARLGDETGLDENRQTTSSVNRPSQRAFPNEGAMPASKRSGNDLASDEFADNDV